MDPLEERLLKLEERVRLIEREIDTTQPAEEHDVERARMAETAYGPEAQKRVERERLSSVLTIRFDALGRIMSVDHS